MVSSSSVIIKQSSSHLFFNNGNNLPKEQYHFQFQYLFSIKIFRNSNIICLFLNPLSKKDDSSDKYKYILLGK